MPEERKIIARNRKARRDYHIEEDLEAGLSLVGCEVKSIRAGKVSIGEAYVRLDGKGALIVGMHVNHYPPAGPFQPREDRSRRLLLHKREIRHLRRAIERKGMTVVPLELYLRGSLIKLKIGVARGKRQYDKRDAMRKRDDERTARRTLKERSS